MRVQWVFNAEIPNRSKAALERWLERKQPRLDRLLSRYGADLKLLRLTVHRLARGGGYQLRGVLELPTGTLVAEARGNTPGAGISSLLETLVGEVKKHKAKVRGDQSFRRKLRKRQDLSAAGPQLTEALAAGRRARFFELLRPALQSLFEHARHELRLAELEGSLPAGHYAPEDLVDEVLSQAWQQFDERPQRTPLDLWLLSLMRDRLKQWCAEPRPIFLSEQAPQAAADHEEADEWWAMLLANEGAPALEEVIADRPSPAEQLGEGEPALDGRVLSLVRRLAPRQRQMLLLHVLEGYRTAELAMLFDASEQQIRSELRAAQQALRQWLEAGDGRMAQAANEPGTPKSVAPGSDDSTPTAPHLDTKGDVP